MDCLKTNCNATENDRMISCWLCEGNYHLKCSGLRARDADALADRAKSLHWTCSRCRKINVEFYKFFKSYKEQYEQLSKDFVAVQNKLSDFGELFTKFANLDKCVSSQNPPSLTNKISLNKAQLHSSIADAVVITDGAHPPPTPLEISSHQQFFASQSLAVDQGNLNQASSPTIPPDVQLLNVNCSNSNLNGISSPILSPNEIYAQNQPAVRELRVVPPRKSVFVSRFSSDTTIEDIDYYLKSKLVSNANISTYKFSYSQPRSIASFKITVPFDIFDKVLDPCFWPDNALVREFVYKENPRTRNNVARLPVQNATHQKN